MHACHDDIIALACVKMMTSLLACVKMMTSLLAGPIRESVRGAEMMSWDLLSECNTTPH